MAHIVEEGFRTRNAADIVGYVCVLCKSFGTATDAYGGCLRCGNIKTLQPVKSKARLHEETEAMKDTQRYQPLQREFNAQSVESQWGSPLTPDQLLQVLRKFNSGVVMRQAYNHHINRQLMALYVRMEPSADDIYRSEFEQKQRLQFVCACESVVMPEWDIIPLNSDGTPQTPIRGWRSVLGIFYRAGIIPFVPDGGKRLSWHQIGQSPLKRPTITGAKNG